MARKMAELPTQATLLEKIPEWSASRLGNYEASISTPGPDDILRIAKATQSSPCWLMFGLGPIRPNARDLQAIRHQNLCNTYEAIKDQRKDLTALLTALKFDNEQLQQYIDNPFQTIVDATANQYENHLNLPNGWMDEQHIEHDPLCLSFPEDIRELITLFSSIDQHHRNIVLNTTKTLVKGLKNIDNK
jgi:hypothetical protein